MQIWLTVIILFSALLALHAYYLRRDYRSLKQQWRELDDALHKRQDALREIMNAIPELAEALGTDLKLLLQRAPDPNPKSWMQRAALESRLSIQAGQALKQIEVGTGLSRRLDNLDSAVQLSLRIYQIVAHRFNHRRDSFPGNMLAALTGLPNAPEFDIDTIEKSASKLI